MSPTTIDCDVLIIGSGPIGATFARQILKPYGEGVNSGDLPPRIIMVEAGAQESKVPGEHKKNAVYYQKDIDAFVHVIHGSLHPTSVPTQTNRNLTLPPVAWSLRTEQTFNGQNKNQDPYKNLDANAVTRAVGGMGTHWTCSTPRQHEIERSKIFDDQEWSELYDKAEGLIGTSETVLKDSIRQRLVLETLGKDFKSRGLKALPLAAKKVENKNLITWSSAATVLGDLAHLNTDQLRPVFTILDQHLCKKLNVVKDEENEEHGNGKGTVRSATLEDLSAPGDRDAKIITAKYFIAGRQVSQNSRFVSAAPQVGMLGPSLTRPQAWHYTALTGISQGFNLTEQPMCFCQVVLKDELIQRLQNDKWGKDCDRHRRKHPDDILRIPYDDLDPQVTLPFSPDYPWHTQIHRDAFSYGAISPAIDKRTIVDLRYFMLMQPQDKNTKEPNRVSFEDSITDAYGMPQPTFDFKLSDKDRSRSHKMMEDMQNVAGKLGGYLPGSEPQFLAPGLALHPCGTTTAAKKDNERVTETAMKDTSCCNEFSRIWDTTNLYVGGLNVIPGPNASNPTLTAMCFAIKSAEDIRRRLGVTTKKQRISVKMVQTGEDQEAEAEETDPDDE
ncbi:hypothetical protein FZEAL_7155 [Fusarium zealandicum]|uniref:Pyranose 2-oxidase n=1 Tax=Fusarium zealandicum TaxID=1053134 RepID=A0A8H4UGA0_9HYPO|nr:hypothetical protein FZEAL_7155 [Fusarium zealandicum]